MTGRSLVLLSAGVGALAWGATGWAEGAAHSIRARRLLGRFGQTPSRRQDPLAIWRRSRPGPSDDLPRLLETVATGLRGGQSLPAALNDGAAAGGSIGSSLARLLDRRGADGSVDDCLLAWTQADPAPGAALAAAALGLASELGGGQAQAIDGVAASLRSRLALQQELWSLTSQARASALVMAATPPFFAVVAAATDPGTLRFLATSAPGLGCVTVGITLDLIGLRWMTRITRGVER